MPEREPWTCGFDRIRDRPCECQVRGGHLFRDLVQGNAVDVVVKSQRKTFTRTVTLEDIGFARLATTRSAFKNYTALVNPRSRPVNSTIFSVIGMPGPFRAASISGCGEINPLENDPGMRTVGPGTHILVNGGDGYVMGTVPEVPPSDRTSHFLLTSKEWILI